MICNHTWFKALLRRVLFCIFLLGFVIYTSGFFIIVVYETEFYYIQNYSLTNATAYQNITLYDLLNASSQVFELVVKDAAFIALEDALIEVKRKYIEDGVFRIVELPKTDRNGETIAHLTLNDVIYTFNIVKYGATIATFNDVRAVCATPTLSSCVIDFNAFATEVPVPETRELVFPNEKPVGLLGCGLIATPVEPPVVITGCPPEVVLGT